MRADYVAQMMESWREDTGLVCSTPQGSRPDGFWAEVEIAFLNTLQARWQYAGEFVGLGFAQGKSMLWHKPFLDANGGIEALGAEIAEDAAATKLVRRAGRHVHLVGKPFEQPLGRRSATEVVQRQYRWAKLRLSTFLPLYAGEIFTSALVASLMIGFGFAWVAGLAALAAWYLAEFAMIAAIGWYVSWRTPFAFLARDLVLPAIWAYAFVGRNVAWRGNVMTIDVVKPPTARSAGSTDRVRI
jgi:ceramide glucosyltransferase